MSLPEVLLWQRLRSAPNGAKFRRQHPIGPYVVDFCCVALRLAVEIDGEAHGCGDRPLRDAARDMVLEENGYRVIRVAANDVLRDVEAVAASTAPPASRPLHHSPAASGPPPRSREE